MELLFHGAGFIASRVSLSTISCIAIFAISIMIKALANNLLGMLGFGVSMCSSFCECFSVIINLLFHWHARHFVDVSLI